MATSTTKSTSASKQQGGSTSVTQQTGGSTSQTQSTQNTHSVTNTSSVGGSSSESTGKSWASGTISDRTQANYDKATETYAPSASVQSAYDRLQETLTGKPSFNSQYEASLNGLYQQIMNRPQFNYDFNADKMYGIYRDQYTAAGRQAMEDTMGQAAAMTGGYGSSYGQSVGQQTYQGYMQQLNSIIPTLRDQARAEYEAEGQRQQNLYALTSDAYQREYGRYRDQVSDWTGDRGFNQSAYESEASRDRSQYDSDRAFWQQQYWNEKNAEQSQASHTQGTNWSNSTSVSDSTTNGTSITNGTNWSNSNTQGTNWSNSSSSNTSVTNTPDISNAVSVASAKLSGNYGNKMYDEIDEAFAGLSAEEAADLIGLMVRKGGVRLADGSFVKVPQADFEAMFNTAYPDAKEDLLPTAIGRNRYWGYK